MSTVGTPKTPEEIQHDWDTNPRWKGLERTYTPADVVALQGSVVECRCDVGRRGGVGKCRLEVRLKPLDVSPVEGGAGEPAIIPDTTRQVRCLSQVLEHSRTRAELDKRSAEIEAYIDGEALHLLRLRQTPQRR